MNHNSVEILLVEDNANDAELTIRELKKILESNLCIISICYDEFGKTIHQTLNRDIDYKCRWVRLSAKSSKASKQSSSR